MSEGMIKVTSNGEVKGDVRKKEAFHTEIVETRKTKDFKQREQKGRKQQSADLCFYNRRF